MNLNLDSNPSSPIPSSLPPTPHTPFETTYIPSTNTFENVHEYTSHFMKLMALEKEADRQTTIQPLPDVNITWLPQQINAISAGGSSLLAQVKLTPKQQQSFRAAASTRVQITHQYFTTKRLLICGFIRSISSHQITILIDQSISIDLGTTYNQFPTTGFTLTIIFDESLYQRIDHALNILPQQPPLVLPMILGHPQNNNNNHNIALPTPTNYLPEIITTPPGFFPLNESQQNAIILALQSNIVCIRGPPGTGKSTTMASLIYHLKNARERQYQDELLHYDKSLGEIQDEYNLDNYINAIQNKTLPQRPTKPGPILISAPSNVAVDHLAGLLFKCGNLDVLRISSKRYQALKFSTTDDQVENSALHRRIEAWLKSNPSSELGRLHQQIFGSIKSYNLLAKIDTIINDDTIVNLEDKSSTLMSKPKSNNESNNTNNNNNDDNNNSNSNTKNGGSDLFVQKLLSSFDRTQSQALSCVSQGELTLWRKLYLNLQQQIILSADVVCCTLALTSNQLLFGGLTFEHVLIDETSQATEPQMLLPLLYNPKHLILFGDPQQLGPVIQSWDASNGGLDNSLFNRLLSMKPEVGVQSTMLNIQYRMHPIIARFSSKEFYNNLLLDGITSEQRQGFSTLNWPNPQYPICFLSSNRLGDESRVGTSISNNGEALLIETIVVGLLQRGIPLNAIGIVIPYSAQTRALQSLLCNPHRPAAELIFNRYFKNKPNRTIEHATKLIEERLEISSVDAYQGREKPFIIFGLVRTQRKIGFLNNPCRMNVALTRAQHGLIIIGDHKAVDQQIWSKLIQFHQQLGTFVDSKDTNDFITNFTKMKKGQNKNNNNGNNNNKNGNNNTNNNNNQQQKQILKKQTQKPNQ